MTDWMYSITPFQMPRKIPRCVETLKKNALVKFYATKGKSPLFEAISIIFHLTH